MKHSTILVPAAAIFCLAALSPQLRAAGSGDPSFYSVNLTFVDGETSNFGAWGIDSGGAIDLTGTDLGGWGITTLTTSLGGDLDDVWGQINYYGGNYNNFDINLSGYSLNDNFQTSFDAVASSVNGVLSGSVDGSITRGNQTDSQSIFGPLASATMSGPALSPVITFQEQGAIDAPLSINVIQADVTQTVRILPEAAVFQAVRLVPDGEVTLGLLGAALLLVGAWSKGLGRRSLAS